MLAFFEHFRHCEAFENDTDIIVKLKAFWVELIAE